MAKVIDFNLHIIKDEDTFYFCVYDASNGILRFNGNIHKFYLWFVDVLKKY